MSVREGLGAGVPIVDSTGAPTPYFLVYMQQITSGLANTSGAAMPTPAPVIIQTDYTGAILSGELPRVVRVIRTLNDKDVSSRTRWFMTITSGTVAATIDQAGAITITSLSSPKAVLQVKSIRDGVTLVCNVPLSLGTGAAPSSGSGGVTATTFSSIISTTPATITADLSITVGASGTVTLTAPLNVSTTQSSPNGTFPVFGKWQWYNGATWVDVAAEVQSSPDTVVTSTFEDTVPPHTYYDVAQGLLTANTAKTGLTAGSVQKFHLMARNGSGTRAMTFSGTASVTTS